MLLECLVVTILHVRVHRYNNITYDILDYTNILYGMSCYNNIAYGKPCYSNDGCG